MSNFYKWITASDAGPDIIRSHLFSKTPNGLYHVFGAGRCNLIHCQLRNCSSNLYKDLFDHFLSDSPACRNCNCKTKDSYHYFFKCPAYNTIREVLFENIFNLHINESIQLTYWCLVTLIWITWPIKQIFEYVHEYMKLSKRFN